MILVNQKKLILSLIKEDLRAQRLLLGLEEIGLQADFYATDLFSLVLDIMEFESHKRMKLYELYHDFLEKQLMPVTYYDLPDKLKALSIRLYIFLQSEKRNGN